MYTKRFRAIVLTLVLIPFTYSGLFAQYEKMPTPDLKAAAEKEFNAGQYGSAFGKFEALIKRYPKDGYFNYQAGLCLIRNNEEPSKAIPFLEAASTKSVVPYEVFYQLGMAYRRNYQFAESRTAFTKYAQAATKQELKDRQAVREAEMSGNAIELTKEYHLYEVVASSSFSFNDSAYIAQVKSKGGKLSLKPQNFFAPGEKKTDYTALAFLSLSSEKGDIFYYSGFMKSGNKTGSDLFRVKRTAAGTWGKPEPLSALNTPFDEILPYFDPVGKDLYFASRGHNSMGGFDIFKSHYDEERDIWTDPMNVGFPLNSPANDFLLLPGADLGTFTIVTDRVKSDSFDMVFSLQMKDRRIQLASEDLKEKKKVGNLSGGETRVAESVNPVQIQEKNVREEIKPESTKQSSEGVKPNIQYPEGYHERLSLAMRHQVIADSLTILARDGRIRARSISDADERWQLQKQIIEWERLADDNHKKSEDLYRLTGGKPLEGSLTPAIRKDTVKNGIGVYTFNKPDSLNIKRTNPEKNNEVAGQTFLTENEPGIPVKTPGKQDNNQSRFLILDRSPYNEQNPFPLDQPLPEGPFYRIQLGVFSQKPAWNAFGGLTPVTAEKVPGKTMVRYYAGKFDKYTEARNALEKVKQSGFRDAFIVAWYNREKLPVDKVMEFEKRTLGTN